MGQPGRALERQKDGMVDDWWQSVPGKITAPPTLRWESGGKSVAIFPGCTVSGMLKCIKGAQHINIPK